MKPRFKDGDRVKTIGYFHSRKDMPVDVIGTIVLKEEPSWDGETFKYGLKQDSDGTTTWWWPETTMKPLESSE